MLVAWGECSSPKPDPSPAARISTPDRVWSSEEIKQWLGVNRQPYRGSGIMLCSGTSRSWAGKVSAGFVPLLELVGLVELVWSLSPHELGNTALN